MKPNTILSLRPWKLCATRISELQIDPGLATLSIWGDSLLECNQVRGDVGVQRAPLAGQARDGERPAE